MKPQYIPTIIDRLIDDNPEQSMEPVQSRLEDFTELRQALLRDLDSLLNTRQPAISTKYKLAVDSVIAYGLPDFTHLSVKSPQDQALIRLATQNVITKFEPRLTQVQVSLETDEINERAIRLRVTAQLLVEPVPLPVTFDALLEPLTGHYTLSAK
jgi:type VI secretion system protein ImpF